MRNRTYTGLLGSTIVIFVAACGVLLQVPPTGASSAKNPVEIVNTYSPSPTFKSTSTKTSTQQPSQASQVTFTHRPTQAFFPSRTIAPSQTITPSQTISEWHLEWTATVKALATEAALYHLQCNPQAIFQPSASPDENWLAVGCDNAENVFIVTNRDGSRSWSVLAGHLPGQWLGDYLGDTRYCDSAPIQWSPDSRYVYFYLYYCVEADYVADYASHMNPNSHRVLYQMDTLTGNYVEFIPGANAYSFSPTGRRLLYITRYGYTDGAKYASIKLSFVDLRTGETKDFWLENTLAAANVIWSEDGRRTYFVAEKGIPWAIFYLHQNRKTNLPFMRWILKSQR
jgi:hypothetical protein